MSALRGANGRHSNPLTCNAGRGNKALMFIRQPDKNRLSLETGTRAGGGGGRLWKNTAGLKTTRTKTTFKTV